MVMVLLTAHAKRFNVSRMPYAGLFCIWQKSKFHTVSESRACSLSVSEQTNGRTEDNLVSDRMLNRPGGSVAGAVLQTLS